jgi:ComF family protein
MKYFFSLPDRVRRAVLLAREYFFPFGCSICGADLFGNAGAMYGLCGTCRDGIERELAENRAGERCDYCGKPLISEHGRCLSCREGEGRCYTRVQVLFPYTGKYRRLLAAYKFDKNPAVGNFLAENVLEALGSFPPEAQIVPVPPRPGKIRKMGWDQVEYLTRLLERDGGGAIHRLAVHRLAISRCLKRMPSKSQKELGRENRRINLQGRIAVVRQVPQIAVVLDDVMTTGSTLDACAAALKEAGTQTVYGLCLFYD